MGKSKINFPKFYQNCNINIPREYINTIIAEQKFFGNHVFAEFISTKLNSVKIT